MARVLAPRGASSRTVSDAYRKRVMDLLDVVHRLEQAEGAGPQADD